MSTLPYDPTPGMPTQTSVPLPVQLAVAGPAQQQRVTVFFRVFMAIPHFVVLYFLGIVAAIIAFIGWWAALFTGRLPEFAQTYLTGFYYWSVRVQAYLFLLTDVYPPFSFDDDPNYPVRFAVPPPTRLNRLAVLFRVFLVIPASLLGGLAVMGGMTIVGFVAWLITLITGRLPESLHLAYTAILRYTYRVSCYLYLLTPAYPGGLFGDGPAVPAGAAVPPPGGGTPDAGDWAPGGDLPAGDWTPGGYDAPSGYGTPSGYGVAPDYGVTDYGAAGYGGPAGYGVPAGGPGAGDAAPGWPLLLTSGARQLIGWFIGIGAVLYVAEIVVWLIIASSSIIVTGNAISTMNAANATLSAEASNWESTTQSCTTLDCYTTADATAATFFSSFATTLRNTRMPAGAVAAADQLYSDATKAAQDLTQLSQATSVAQYQSTLASTGMEQTLNQFDQDNTALGHALHSSP